AVTDSGNGKYYATFTATTSGTAKNIRARIGTDTVQTTQPTVTVNAGTFSTSTSVISIASSSILKYDTTTVTLQVKDGSGNNVTTGGLNVEIQIFGSANPVNNGKAYLTDVVDNQNGTYTSKLIGLTTSTGTAITSYIYNSGTSSYQQVNSFPSPVTVNARPVSLSLSTVAVGAVDGKFILGGDLYFYLYARNDKGEPYTETNLGLNFSLGADGTSGLTPNSTYQNMGGGVYEMSWHGTSVGTPRNVTTTIDGNPITSTLPTITIVPAGPGVTYPPYSQHAVPLDTTFYWDASTGATTYRVQIVADSLAGSVIIDSSGIAATSFHVTGLQNYRTYYFRLEAMYAGIESEIWNERDFKTIISTPLQIFPPDRETQVGIPAAFGWNFSPGAASYHLQVSADTGFSSLVTDKTIIDSVTNDTLAGLAAGTKYFWRLSATGDGGTTAYCTVRSFNTASVVGGQQVYYVKPGGNDAAAGTSWGTAFATVQQGLTMAAAGSQVWVAAGTYKPTATLDRSISFQLKNGVSVYGGFSGNETDLSQRNWQTNVCILSGDIDGDATSANNSYHVVVGNTFATALLDGFTITGGNADVVPGGGIYCVSGYPILSNLIVCNNKANDLGGGMYNSGGSPTLTNVTFKNNQSANRGGGMYSDQGAPRFTNCTFSNNTGVDGAGMWNGNYNYPGTSNSVFTNVVFKNNTASHNGGGLYTDDGVPVFTNVLFYQNSAGSGGGIYNTNGNITFANVTFNGNNASDALPNGGGGGLFVWLSSVVLQNVILWGNTPNALFNGQIYNGQSSKVTLFNSLLQDGMPVHGGDGIVNFYGGVDVDSGGNIFTDPLFINAGTGDVRIGSSSPAIDAGTNAAVSTISDLSGNPRIVGSNVDIGAYEYQGATASFSKIVSQSDSLNQLGATKVDLEFSGIAPGKSVLVFSNRYATAADSVTFTGSVPSHYSPFRWVIAKAGDPFSSAVFSLENVSSYSGVVDPASLVIYHRSTPGAGDFSPLTTTYDAGSDKLTATITSFSEFMIGSNTNPLPVEITSFTGTSDRLNAKLDWKTATEINNYGFEVERRVVNPADTSKPTESSWTKAGFVRGAGTSSSPKEYGFTDRNLQAGRYAFRLKQINNDGAFVYSTSVEFEVGAAPRVFTLSQNYPNPFNPTTTVEFTIPDDGKTTLVVYNVLGQQVVTLVDQQMKAGEYHQTFFDASRLSSGIYFSVLRFSNKQLVKKMMFLK
ncbi:MAG TPA: choice-of-anchor Q domain-containing protein, partial [Bacteroidota bacterium]|nr:choice-of-anchor Q domain-containing protein [Bacteroidota bacterium]